MYERELLSMDFDACVQYLTNLPMSIDEDQLFAHIERLQQCANSILPTDKSKTYAQWLCEVEERHVNDAAVSSGAAHDV